MVSRNHSTPLIGDSPQLRAVPATKLNSFIRWDVVNLNSDFSPIDNPATHAPVEQLSRVRRRW